MRPSSALITGTCRRDWLVGVSLTLVMMAGCLSEDLHIEASSFACQDDDDCLDGYRCLEDEASRDEVCTFCRHFAFEPGACAACVEGACCVEAERCRGEETCRAMIECELGCRGLPPERDPAACLLACDDLLRDGVSSAWSALNACRASRCGEACDEGCGLLPRPTPPSTASDCERCMTSRCCEPSRACSQDEGCLDALSCVYANPLFDEVLACIDFPEPGLIGDMFACQRSECVQECGVGQLWACLDDVSVKRTPPAPMALTFHVQDFLTTRPLPDLDVYVCPDFDGECATPLPATCPERAPGCALEALTDARFQTTDAQGDTRLNILKPQEGFRGHFEIIDPDADPEQGRGHVPMRYFVNPALTSPELSLIAAPLSNTTMRAFEAQAGTWDRAAHGQVLVTLRDCGATRAVGGVIRAEGAEGLRIAYARGGLPDVNARDTDTTGTAVILDVPPGPLTLIASTGDGSARDFSVARVHVKAGYLHYVEMGPNIEGGGGR